MLLSYPSDRVMSVYTPVLACSLSLRYCLYSLLKTPSDLNLHLQHVNKVLGKAHCH